jgi:hypothetical protein
LPQGQLGASFCTSPCMLVGGGHNTSTRMFLELDETPIVSTRSVHMAGITGNV